MSLDVDRLADAVLAGTQALIAKALAPLKAENAALVERNAALEARLSLVEGREAPDVSGMISDAIGPLRDAASKTMEMVRSLAERPQEAEPFPDVTGLVTESVRVAVEALPAPVNGKDADPAALEALREEIAEVRRSIPEPVVVPEPVDLSGLATKADVAEVVASIPAPVAPVDLTPFATKDDVARAISAVRLPEPVPGRDGAGVIEARQNADGELIVKLTTGETLNAGKVRGEDGLGFDDMTVDYDGDRLVTLVFAKGEREVRKDIVLPVPIDRGVWREGEYRKGDGVTWAGAFWIAQCDTAEKPEASAAWRLAVKKGKDGRPAPAPRPETVRR